MFSCTLDPEDMLCCACSTCYLSFVIVGSVEHTDILQHLALSCSRIIHTWILVYFFLVISIVSFATRQFPFCLCCALIAILLAWAFDLMMPNGQREGKCKIWSDANEANRQQNVANWQWHKANTSGLTCHCSLQLQWRRRHLKFHPSLCRRCLSVYVSVCLCVCVCVCSICTAMSCWQTMQIEGKFPSQINNGCSWSAPSICMTSQRVNREKGEGGQPEGV